MQNSITKIVHIKDFKSFFDQSYLISDNTIALFVDIDMFIIHNGISSLGDLQADNIFIFSTEIKGLVKLINAPLTYGLSIFL